jgi:hypothetical protein
MAIELIELVDWQFGTEAPGFSLLIFGANIEFL